MLNALAIALVVLGLAILLAALPPTRRLILELPAGPMRSQWRLLVGLVLFFVAGHTVYLFFFRDRHQSLTDLLVPVVFLGTGCFVWLAARLSLAIVVNVRRMSTLDRENVTDALSGLDSRHYLDRRMREEMMRAERHGLAVSVMLFDIDDFASVNAN